MSSQPGRVFFYGQLLVIASLPVHFLISSYAIGLLLIIFLFEIFRNSEFRRSFLTQIRDNNIGQLLILFFVIYLLSVLLHFDSYSDNSATSILEMKLSFLFFPLLFASFADASKARVRLSLKVYVISILATSLYALLTGLYQTIVTDSLYYYDPNKMVVFNNFMYHRLGSYVGMHAVYYAEYVMLAFIIVVSYSYYHFPNWRLKWRIGSIILGLYLIGFMFLLKSAAILLILLVIISLFTVYYLYRSRDKISITAKWVIPIVTLAIVAVLAVRAFDKIGNKASFFSYDFAEPGGGNWNAINLRLAKWDVAQMAIKDHWLVGVGPGNILETLDKYYTKVGFHYALQLHYNPHNQFLHTLITLGIAGFTVLVLIYLTSIRNSLKKQDSVMFLFLISFLLFSLSESNLAVNKGIVFFTLFLSFFSYLPHKVSTYLNDNISSQ